MPREDDRDDGRRCEQPDQGAYQQRQEEDRSYDGSGCGWEIARSQEEAAVSPVKS